MKMFKHTTIGNRSSEKLVLYSPIERTAFAMSQILSGFNFEAVSEIVEKTE